MQRGVVIPAAGGSELRALSREDTEIVETLLGSEPDVASQNLRWIEGDGAPKDFRGKVWRRLHSNGTQAWFVRMVPAFQRRLQIALEKINRSEKILRVAIVRIEPAR